MVPRASRNEIVGFHDGYLKVRLNAPPLKGEANIALQQFLAKKLGVSKRDVEIVTGKRSREKTIRIHGLSFKKVKETLDQ